MVDVAIIDDGAGIGLYDTYDIAYSIEITADIMVQNVDRCKLQNDSHGTICAAIVKKYYPKAMLTSIKILNNKTHKCINKQLIKAIEWCVDNGIQIANLSLGTIDYRDFEMIKDTINKAYNRGLIIVAACNNRDIFTSPASFSNVIGVKCSENNVLKEGEYIFNLYPIDGIEVTSCSEHALLKNDGEFKTTSMCNSFAAPMITAEVCKIVDKYPNITLEKTKQELYKRSTNYIDNTTQVNNYKNIDWITNAALLYVGEEEYNSELPYINQIKVLKKFEDIDTNLFDTLILLNSDKRDYEEIKSIIYKFEKKQKSIVVINDEFQYENHEEKYPNNNIKFWHHSIINHFYEVSLPQKEMDVPLIIVYDYTESKMIKALETLTFKFRSDGYYALGACTKSIGALYGLEYIPFSKDENFKALKDKIEVLYRVYDYDIIILGLSINKEDSNIIKKINMCLNPDKTIFLVNNFIHEVKTGIEKMSANQPLVITLQENIKEYYDFGYKIFKYRNLDLFYSEILEMFLCQSK
ncbi:subtilase family protease [Clostridium botulinum]|uniref:Subtilase family protease n=1 Tax=Clostridium botulinum TaxID=1491 RepID=A0A6B4PP98_CLOBO|nr:S8 family serine peptidase [Clostridium botulinum]NFE59420.1 subtilase family protease [Clostridium botulinum]NFE74547.1 subtilase family protease [Clostridium botulinum]NFE94789.1 subtilase family protease [Clostridium botulinum]NFF88958.1 subtilase family protease [Clostridium botulinum]NFG11418.1 subtilase family protease [Clostridium botulinum]